MPQVPPTPFLPHLRKGGDASLLVDESMFGDVTLDEQDYGFPAAGPSRLQGRSQAGGVDTCSGLSVTRPGQKSCQTFLRDRISSSFMEDSDSDPDGDASTPCTLSSKGGMKRDASLTSLRASEENIKQGKSASRSSDYVLTHTVRVRENDDLYSRRLAKETRRASFDIPRGASPEAPSWSHRDNSPSGASASKSSSSRSQVFSYRQQYPGDSRTYERKKRDDDDAEQVWSGSSILSSANATVQDDLSPAQPRIRGTALSRYLAHSAVLQGDSRAADQSAVPAMEGSSQSSTLSLAVSSSRTSLPIPVAMSPSVIHLGLKDASVPGSLETVPQNSIHVEVSSPKLGDQADDHPISSTVYPLSNQTPTDSRRSSTGMRVIGFLAGLIKRPTTPSQSSNSAEANLNITSEPCDVVSSQSVSMPATKHQDNAAHLHVLTSPKVPPLVKPKSAFALTKPRPFVASTRQPLQRSRTVATSSNIPPQQAQGFTKPAVRSAGAARTPKLQTQSSNVDRAPKPRVATTSSFTASALARLPPPGRGSSRAAEPLFVKPTERAADLAKRRAVFEGGSTAPHPTVKSVSKPTADTRTLPKTVPIRGHTPGKASRIRAEQRSIFDAAVRERIEEKERVRREEERRRQEEEEEAYQRSRKETVIRAHPVPDIYYDTKK